MGLGVDSAVVFNCINFLSFGTDLRHGVLGGVLKLLDETVDNIDEDDLGSRSIIGSV